MKLIRCDKCGSVRKTEDSIWITTNYYVKYDSEKSLRYDADICPSCWNELKPKIKEVFSFLQ